MVQVFQFDEFFARSADVMEEGSELERALARLPALTENGPWLAGGALRRTLLRKPLESDFDFFFASAEQFEAFCAKVKADGGYTVSSSQHNTTFRLPSTAPKPIGEDEFAPAEPEIIVQAITTQWYGSLADVVDSFDFTLCQFGYDGTHLVCGDYALWDLGRGSLVPHKLTFATASLRRLLKYTKQGYRICSGGLSDMLEQVLRAPEIVRAETTYID